MTPGYILDDSILTMDDYRKMHGRYSQPDPDQKELRQMRLRKYDVIIQHFNQIVSKQTEWTGDDERPSERRIH